MKTVPAGRFKQVCLQLLDEVRETGEPLTITKRGVPVAQLGPVPDEDHGAWLGRLRATGEITGDLVAPATDAAEWEALSS